MGLLGLVWACLGLLGFVWVCLARLGLLVAWACLDFLVLPFVLLELGLKLGLVLSWLVLSCLLLPCLALPCRVSSLVLACLV